MYGGPRHGALRGETGLPLAPRRGQWDTWSTTPAASPESRASATTTFWGRGGVYVQSRSAHLTARVPVAPGPVRGLAPRCREAATHPRPHPGGALRAGAALVPRGPGHRAALRSPLGRPRIPAGGPPTGWDFGVPHLPAPRRRGRRGPLARKLPRLLLGYRRPDEQGFRIYGVVGTPGRSSTRAEPAGRGLRPLRPLDWPQVFDGPQPGLRLMDEEPESTQDTNPTTRR